MAIGVFGVVANETDRARSRPQTMWVFSVDVTKTCDGVVSYIAQWFFSRFGALNSLAFLTSPIPEPPSFQKYPRGYRLGR